MSAGGEIASFGDGLFEVLKAQQAATHAAYTAGFDAGYQAGMAKALEIINASGERAAARDAANVCPTCHGRGASATDAATGKTVYYCNCAVQS
jgi:cytochrome c553